MERNLFDHQDLPTFFTILALAFCFQRAFAVVFLLASGADVRIWASRLLAEQTKTFRQGHGGGSFWFRGKVCHNIPSTWGFLILHTCPKKVRFFVSTK